MKNTLQCPKCGCREVIYAPGGLLSDQNKVFLPGSFLEMKVRIAHYICRDCGFAETWVDRHDDLEKLRRADPIIRP